MIRTDKNREKKNLGWCSKQHSMYDQDIVLVWKPKDWFIR